MAMSESDATWEEPGPQRLSEYETGGDEAQHLGGLGIWIRQGSGFSPKPSPETNVALPTLEFRNPYCTFTQQKSKVINFYCSDHQVSINLLQ